MPLLLFDTIWVMWPLFAHTLPFLSIAFMETPGIAMPTFPTLLPNFGNLGRLAVGEMFVEEGGMYSLT